MFLSLKYSFSKGKLLTGLAKQAVENYVKERKVISLPHNLPEEFLTRKAGVFVTIEKNLRGLPRSQAKLVLRGCIGTYLPTQENIAQEIIHNAVAAAIEDYRFGPIQKEELSQLSYVVYILSEPELVLTKEVSDPPKFFFEKLRRASLNPQKFGVIIKTTPITQLNDSIGSSQVETDVVFNGHLPSKTGLLLPSLENIDTVEKQILIACQKGDINPNREKIIIYRFTTKKYQ